MNAACCVFVQRRRTRAAGPRPGGSRGSARRRPGSPAGPTAPTAPSTAGGGEALRPQGGPGDGLARTRRPRRCGPMVRAAALGADQQAPAADRATTSTAIARRPGGATRVTRHRDEAPRLGLAIVTRSTLGLPGRAVCDPIGPRAAGTGPRRRPSAQAAVSQRSLATSWKPSPPSWSLNGYSPDLLRAAVPVVGREDRRWQAGQVHQPDREERRRLRPAAEDRDIEVRQRPEGRVDVVAMGLEVAGDLGIRVALGRS